MSRKKKQLELHWETFELKHDRAKEFKAEDFRDKTPKDCLFLIAMNTFGACCSIEELWQITEIAYKGYERMNKEAEERLNKKTGTAKYNKIKSEVKDYEPKKS